MWIFCPVGFFSITQLRDDKTKVQVRVRVKDDLDAIRKRYMPDLGPTLAKVGTDYPYRAYISKENLALGMARIALDIDYSNFKSEVERVQGLPREMLYMKIWTVMSGAEQKLGELKRNVSRQPFLGEGSAWAHGGSGHEFDPRDGAFVPAVSTGSKTKKRGVRRGKRK